VNSNPFATRFTRPGAIPYLFAEGESTAMLVERLRSHDWCGQIIGQHGSGKSTLLAVLAPALEAAGRTVVSLALHQGQRQLPPLDRAALAPLAQLIIDGYEQLSWWSRWRASSFCRRARAGLLVTAHSDVGLPTIYHTQPSEALAQRVVKSLLPAGEVAITSADVSAAFSEARGNVRETLFNLFDIYQQKMNS
jgi:energy-coupling factor transporter ATP-binding protein EcfA2